MSRIGWTICTITSAALLGLALSLEPWQKFREEAEESARVQAETRKAEQQRGELLQESAELESPYGMEEQARGKGYRKPNERPLSLD